MQSQKHVKSSGIFLIELILAIFFFSLASAVCVQIFVKSHLLSQDSKCLNVAVNECSSIAEVLTTSDSSSEASEILLALYPQMLTTAPSSAQLYYDNQFKPCDKANGVYQLSVQLQDFSDYFEAQLTFIELTSGNSIYSIDVLHHVAKEVQP